MQAATIGITTVRGAGIIVIAGDRCAGLTESRVIKTGATDLNGLRE